MPFSNDMGDRRDASSKVTIPISVPSRNILVLENVEEIRDAIEALLRRDGYRVSSARSEDEAVAKSHADPPDVILVSLDGTTEHVLNTARSIRDSAGLTLTPIVIFSITHFREGLEERIGDNIFVTAPDNFDQLRTLLSRVLRESCKS
jgi:CheY-like chemotaxis protein